MFSYKKNNSSLSGWGKNKFYSSDIYSIDSYEDIPSLRSYTEIIPRGLGRSYGDSSVGKNVLETRSLKRIIDFDEKLGLIECESGISFSTLLEIVIPKGWFIPVVAGTKNITLGGAIASDIHGKNHHKDGTLSNWIESLEILTGDGKIVTSSNKSHPDLFFATCGGMGLTGIILKAKLKLKKINSTDIIEEKFKIESLEELLDKFEEYNDSDYSVAWIDLSGSSAESVKSILSLGSHSSEGELRIPKKREISVPKFVPPGLINNLSIRLFNKLYYSRFLEKRVTKKSNYNNFFFPLDYVSNWNNLYGKRGFLQYQFVLPNDCGVKELKEIIKLIYNSNIHPSLAVLKKFGKENDNFLSFPKEGLTLALDFRIKSSIFNLLDRLDTSVLNFGGRHYLTKDSFMSEKTFKITYDKWEQFQDIRKKYQSQDIFRSYQSVRLGLN